MAKSRLSLGGFPEEEKGLCRRGWKLRKSEGVIWLLPSLDIHHTHTHSVPRVLGTRDSHPAAAGRGAELWDLGEGRGRLGLEGAGQGPVAFRTS